MKTSAATAPASSGLTSKISQPASWTISLSGDHGQGPGQRADEQPRAPPEQVLGHKGRRYVATRPSRMVTVGHFDRLRCEPLRAPAVRRTPVDQPVVHPARPALPELHRLRVHEVAAPLRRASARRHRRSAAPRRRTPRAAPRGRRRRWTGARPRRRAGSRAGGPRSRRRPRPAGAGWRCRRRGPGARAGATGRAARSAGCRPARCPCGSRCWCRRRSPSSETPLSSTSRAAGAKSADDGRDDHGVGLVQPGRVRLVVPAAEHRDRVGQQVGLDQPAAGVLLAGCDDRVERVEVHPRTLEHPCRARPLALCDVRHNARHG